MNEDYIHYMYALYMLKKHDMLFKPLYYFSPFGNGIVSCDMNSYKIVANAIANRSSEAEVEFILTLKYTGTDPVWGIDYYHVKNVSVVKYE